ncbi:Calpain-8 [Dactylella cylindrospora]|nr:Calpain-8 [Dactylella cylindrospora]
MSFQTFPPRSLGSYSRSRNQRARGSVAYETNEIDHPADDSAADEPPPAEQEPAIIIAAPEGGKFVTEGPSIVPQISKKVPAGSAQKQLNKFWRKFRSNRAGRPTIVLPYNPFSTPPKPIYGPTLPVVATAQYDEAVANCKAKVQRIVRECRGLNQKYRDYHFDLGRDDPRNTSTRYCIDGFSYNSNLTPKGVKRIDEIFDKPSFFKDGATPGDIRQGATGDCWFLAAVATMTNVPGLLEKVCVAKDEEVGVYGFVFFRDGEWISSIVDDQLYLSQEEYHESQSELKSLLSRKGKEAVYTEALLKGSDALYFASCEDKNETWLPLLEKAYAKAHGDYTSIDGGFAGEAVEDLTGGVTTEVWSRDILSRDKFWNEELMKVNKEFLFAGWFTSTATEDRDGIMPSHSYSVLKAKEIDGQRLVLVRNPWGRFEWKGPWSDGSREWTSYWIEQLEHKFGDDGSFWMSYNDFLRTFRIIDRTRLFDSSWSVTSSWVSEPVEWENTYSKNRFQITVPEKAKVIIVLQQLDDRYFKGLEGEYVFDLHFRVHRPEEPDYFIRSRANCLMWRSVSCEVELEAGVWDVAYKITATKSDDKKSVEETVKETSVANRRKFLQVGMSYDLAHAKGRVVVRSDELEEDDEDEEDGEGGKAKKDGKDEKSEKPEKDEKPVKDVKDKEAQEEKSEKPKEEVSEKEAKSGDVADGSDKPQQKQQDPNEGTDAPAPPAPDPPSSGVSEPPAPKGTVDPSIKTDPTPDGVSDSKAEGDAKPQEHDKSEASSASATKRTVKPDPQDNTTDITAKDDKEAKPKKDIKKPREITAYMLVPITDEKESDSEDEENMWNALAVVGLRVYSQQKDITVQLVRPKGAAKLLLDPDEKSQEASQAKSKESEESDEKDESGETEKKENKEEEEEKKEKEEEKKEKEEKNEEKEEEGKDEKKEEVKQEENEKESKDKDSEKKDVDGQDSSPGEPAKTEVADSETKTSEVKEIAEKTDENKDSEKSEPSDEKLTKDISAEEIVQDQGETKTTDTASNQKGDEIPILSGSLDTPTPKEEVKLSESENVSTSLSS